MTDVFIVDTKQGLKSAVNEMFSHIEKAGEPILKSKILILSSGLCAT